MEIWKDIKGYEGLYQVSNLGRVRSLGMLADGKNGSKRFVKGRILKPSLDIGGYQRVCLCKNGKHKFCFVHRLVYEAFNGEIPEGMEINHKDENPQNNSLSNLNLLSHKANMNWGTRNERAAKSLIKHSVIQKSLDGEIIKIWPSLIEIQRQLGYNKGHICACCRGGYFDSSIGKWHSCKTVYGYKWEYAEE